MKILAVIPARFDSTRFPGKPLFMLKGKSMIQRVYEGVKKSDKFHDVVVATDDQRIYNEVEKFGGKVLMTSKDHQSGTDRCAEVAAHYPDMEIIINIQGDEPLVNYVQLNQLLEAFKDKNCQIATLGIRSKNVEEFENPNRIKVVVNHNSEALYFSRSGIPYQKEKINNDFRFLRHIGLYAYRNQILREITKIELTDLEKTESLEQLRWLYHGYKIKLILTTIETPNIDTPEDVETVLNYL